ncbi:hypothetical protein D3C78_1658060 [compost metagenome]
MIGHGTDELRQLPQEAVDVRPGVEEDGVRGEHRAHVEEAQAAIALLAFGQRVIELRFMRVVDERSPLAQDVRHERLEVRCRGHRAGEDEVRGHAAHGVEEVKRRAAQAPLPELVRQGQ